MRVAVDARQFFFYHMQASLEDQFCALFEEDANKVGLIVCELTSPICFR